MSSYKILLACCVAILITANSSAADTLESQLIKASELVNSRMPMMVNKDMRADSTYASGNKFTYLYTLVNESSTELPQESLAVLKRQMINGICSHNGLSGFSKRGAEFVYMYRNSTGTFVGEITIPAYECVVKTEEQLEAAKELAVFLHSTIVEMSGAKEVATLQKHRKEYIGCLEEILIKAKFTGTLKQREKQGVTAQAFALKECYGID